METIIDNVEELDDDPFPLNDKEYFFVYGRSPEEKTFKKLRKIKIPDKKRVQPSKSAKPRQSYNECATQHFLIRGIIGLSIWITGTALADYLLFPPNFMMVWGAFIGYIALRLSGLYKG